MQLAGSADFHGDDDHLTVSLGNVGGGDLLVVFGSFDSSSASFKDMVDGAGNKLAVAVKKTEGNEEQTSMVAYELAPGAGTVTLTMELTESTCCRVMVVHEVAHAAALDAGSGHIDDGLNDNGIASSGSFATAHAGDYVFAASSDANNVTSSITAGSGAMQRANLAKTVTGGNATSTEDFIQPAAGAVDATFVYPGGGDAATLAAAFAPAP